MKINNFAIIVAVPATIASAKALVVSPDDGRRACPLKLDPGDQHRDRHGPVFDVEIGERPAASLDGLADGLSARPLCRVEGERLRRI
jgi:hypothetical protein